MKVNPEYSDEKCISFAQLDVFLSDNVCIESMSVKMTRKTLDKCGQNIDRLDKHLQRYSLFRLRPL